MSLLLRDCDRICASAVQNSVSKITYAASTLSHSRAANRSLLSFTSFAFSTGGCSSKLECGNRAVEPRLSLGEERHNCHRTWLVHECHSRCRPRIFEQREVVPRHEGLRQASRPAFAL